jgi:cytochrome c553
MIRGVKTLGFLLLASSRVIAAEQAASPDQIAFFEKKIRPVLSSTCYKCHSHQSKKLKAGLHLDSRAGVLKGGDNGAAIMAGSPDKSLLIKSITYLDNELQMPPKKKLSAAVVADFSAWVKMGAPWPVEKAPVATATTPEAPKDWDKLRNAHWAFRPIANPTPPKVSGAKTPIDAFIGAELKKAGLKANGPAPKYILIRRAYIDLIGLPPTPKQVNDFVNDKSSQAFSKVIDVLLASPQYGERWARHWLDVARYSDGEGSSLDGARLDFAWRYRDWVVKALNDDLPYDQFVTQQLAADAVDSPLAGGFLAVGPTYIGDGGDPIATAGAKGETLDDRVDTVSRAFLALTVSCARCHDHKFDPIPTADYYSLAGIFNNTRLVKSTAVSKAEREAYDRAYAPVRKAESALKQFAAKQADAHRQQIMTKDLAKYLLAAVDYKKAQKKNRRLRPDRYAITQKLSPLTVERMVQWIDRKNTRGRFKEFKKYYDWADAHRKDLAVDEPLRALAAAIQVDINRILTGDKKSEPHRRLSGELRKICTPDLIKSKGVELRSDQKKQYDTLSKAVAEAKKKGPKPLPVAHYLAEADSKDMPIAIRGNLLKKGKVVPRRFLHILVGEKAPHFKDGSGRKELAAAIVDKKNPLTARVMINRIWQRHFGKAIVRTPSNFGILGEKPTHPMLLDHLATQFMAKGWSMKAMHKMIMLSATYQQSSKYVEASYAKDGGNRFVWRMGPRKMEAEAWRDSLLHVTGELDLQLGGASTKNLFGSNRRTLYSIISRNGDRYASDNFLRMFDFPAPRTTSAGRTQSTVPQQYLFMINSSFMIQRAQALAKRLTAQATTDSARIDLAYAILFGRKPEASEKKVSTAYLAVKSAGPPNLQRYVQVLLSTHEFIQIQ